MHIIKFNDNTKDVWVKSCSFPLTIVTEDNNDFMSALFDYLPYRDWETDRKSVV